MSSTDYLRDYYPSLANRLGRTVLASVPTPVREHRVTVAGERTSLAVKYDNLSGDLYGGNKVRKLEYIFPLATLKHCRRIATFGAAGSHHALATALYARRAGFDCTCFLGRQVNTPGVAATLNRHLQNGTTLVSYGGSYANRLNILRRHLWGQDAWVVPMGGSSWLGTVGFVAAGLELASQVRSGDIEVPERIYVATGTMGTAAGIALGLALARLPAEVQAVRVTDSAFANPHALLALMNKTASMMNRLDPAIPPDLARRARITIRNEFFGDGYAISTPDAENAIAFASDAFGLTLESTYTGKAMAAMLADLGNAKSEGRPCLYWHTRHSCDLNVPVKQPLEPAALPAEFLPYFA